MFTDVEIKLKKRNKVLFSRDSKCLQDLIGLIQLQNHRTLVMWALDCAKVPLEQFEAKYPDESRPRTCLELCEDWARGKIKMPIAKRAILDSHAVAKEINDSEYGALCHAIGHAGATVHVETHALGLPFYELTAIVLKYGKNSFQKPISEKINYYLSRLMYWQENTDKLGLGWADFLMDDTRPNKEKLLSDKRKLMSSNNSRREGDKK
ncbi:putative immunity protein [Lutispora sp.]|uniref:putative immunity protein n=1 Tax=Lutispora sp. TaxID=2828727 RepID=UPI0035647397